MNSVIKKQLDKVRSVKINYDDSVTKIFIPKTLQIIPEALNVGDVYIIRLSDNILNPTSNSTLASNWNSGKVPKYKIYKVELLEVINNMYKFNGIAIDCGKEIYSESWFGWFPKEQFEVIEKVEVM